MSTMVGVGTPGGFASTPLNTPTASWDDLNHQAKHVEGQLDVALSAVARGGHLSATHTVDNALAHLSSILDAQSALLASGANVPGTAAATAQRHRDILAEYQREYRRARANLDAQAQSKTPSGLLGAPSTASLLPTSHVPQPLVTNGSSAASTSTDHIIEMAYESRRHLQQQRVALTKKFQGMTDRFPILAGIMSKIRAKKARNAIILMGIMTAILLLVYLFK